MRTGGVPAARDRRAGPPGRPGGPPHPRPPTTRRSPGRPAGGTGSAHPPDTGPHGGGPPRPRTPGTATLVPPGSAGPKPAHRTQARTEAAHHARARLERRPLCRPAARGRSPPTGHRPARRRPTTPAPAWNGDPCAARQRGAEARPPDTGPHGGGPPRPRPPGTATPVPPGSAGPKPAHRTPARTEAEPRPPGTRPSLGRPAGRPKPAHRTPARTEAAHRTRARLEHVDPEVPRQGGTGSAHPPGTRPHEGGTERDRVHLIYLVHFGPRPRPGRSSPPAGPGSPGEVETVGAAVGRLGAEVVEALAAGVDGDPPASRSPPEALAPGEADPADGVPVAPGPRSCAEASASGDGMSDRPVVAPSRSPCSPAPLDDDPEKAKPAISAATDTAPTADTAATARRVRGGAGALRRPRPPGPGRGRPPRGRSGASPAARPPPEGGASPGGAGSPSARPGGAGSPAATGGSSRVSSYAFCQPCAAAGSA
ncbi:hypothetical protein SUDANB148_04416 [Streptomyces sp. SudanB148_2056]